MTPNPAPNEPLYPDVAISLRHGMVFADHLIGRVFVALWRNGYQEGARAFASAAAPIICKGHNDLDIFEDVLSLTRSYVEAI